MLIPRDTRVLRACDIQADPHSRRREVLIVAFAPRVTGEHNYVVTIGTDGQCLLWAYRLDTLDFDLDVRF